VEVRAGLVVAAAEGSAAGPGTGSGAETGAGGGTGAQANSRTIETSRSDNNDRRTHPPTRLLSRRRNNHRLRLGECQLTFGLHQAISSFQKTLFFECTPLKFNKSVSVERAQEAFKASQIAAPT
jgi:hypothetical protein